jgi:YCII-related domain
MAKFMPLYRGDATPPQEMTEEQRRQVRDLWVAWVEKHRAGLAEVGSPLGASVGVGGDGTDQNATSLGGYSIVEADSLEAAKAFTEDHPFLDGAGADFAVDIYEMQPSPV